ncbi:hypothetical protein LCGC14_1540210 [marine sediment metagenome]|uniref:Uncharacterized protein n=1 Tax=marine sediment metagenome TaxID=412755 RepID=A0A0F9ITE5_9ZZZZ
MELENCERALKTPLQDSGQFFSSWVFSDRLDPLFALIDPVKRLLILMELDHQWASGCPEGMIIKTKEVLLLQSMGD